MFQGKVNETGLSFPVKFHLVVLSNSLTQLSVQDLGNQNVFSDKMRFHLASVLAGLLRLWAISLEAVQVEGGPDHGGLVQVQGGLGGLAPHHVPIVQGEVAWGQRVVAHRLLHSLWAELEVLWASVLVEGLWVSDLDLSQRVPALSCVEILWLCGGRGHHVSLQLGEGRGRSLRRTSWWWWSLVQVCKDWENIKCGQATKKPRRPQRKEERKVEVKG